MSELIARRAFAPACIYPDIAFLRLICLWWFVCPLLSGIRSAGFETPGEKLLPLKARIRENNGERVRS